MTLPECPSCVKLDALHCARLKRSCAVEAELRALYKAKQLPTLEKLIEWAVKLGVPDKETP